MAAHLIFRSRAAILLTANSSQKRTPSSAQLRLKDCVRSVCGVKLPLVPPADQAAYHSEQRSVGGDGHLNDAIRKPLTTSE